MPQLTTIRWSSGFVWLAVLALPLGPVTWSAADEESALTHARSLSLAFRKAAEEVTPAVVTIMAKSKAPTINDPERLRELMRDPRLRELFPDGRFPFGVEEGEEGPEFSVPEQLTTQIGSGVVIDKNGLVLTNSHVVANADQVIVRLQDGREVPASGVRTDPLSDVATLTIPTEAVMATARLGEAGKLSIGDWVIAIGSPFELEATVSAGIISGKGRGIDKIKRGRLIQTDAAINPGNSGGPLVDLEGQVIGINTAIASSNGGYQGIGFAIPIERASWIARELAEHGKVRRAFLGIQIDELSPEIARKLGLSPRSGVVVVDAISGGPAAEAGLQRNDVIVEFAGERVRVARDLQDIVEQKPIDSSQAVKYVRDGETRTLQVTLRGLDN
ncbi:MAG: trypsin-like peptidase domain-containing protein [Planctomycetales bacterium]|nr:trypsin-like peptidase domain-containing protein [Planctomycetales bacterium]